MRLVGRDDSLEELREVLGEARRGDGRVAVLAGEAGIGKTSLLRAFVDEHDGLVTLVGSCDDLLTPMPHGPLLEIARSLTGPLSELLRTGAPPERVHDALRTALDRLPPPVVIALEDLHWADDATLDDATVIARWVVEHGALLVTTHRDDEVGPAHPLARVLGRFPAHATTTLRLRALDLDEVAALAGAEAGSADAEAILRLTRGNPFYVTELLAAADSGELPSSVAFAVNARLARLPAGSRELLQLVSLVPGRTETTLLDALEPAWPTLLDPAEQIGIIEVRGTAIAFRHELARRAVADTVSTLRARVEHGRILAALDEATTDAATLVHHAEGAGDAPVLVRHALRAARAAMDAESYREAMANQERALAHPDELTTEQEHGLWFALARARVAAGRHGDEVMAAALRAVELARRLDDPARLARSLARASRLASWACDHAYAGEASSEAVDVARPLGPSRPLAEALVAAAYHGLAHWDFRGTARLAGEARSVAEQAGADDTALLAEMFLGVVAIGVSGDTAPLRAAERAAVGTRNRWAVAEGLMTGSTALHFRREHAETLAAIDRTFAFLGTNDLSGWRPYLHAFRARTLIEVGRWQDAAAELTTIDEGPAVWGWPGVAVLTTRGRFRARLGEDGARDELEQAWAVAADGGTFQMRFGAGTAIAEELWLRDALDEVPGPLRSLEEETRGRRWPAARGEIAVWLARAGEPAQDVPDAVAGHRLLLAGRHVEAAAAWDALGCVYLAAEARVLSDDPDAILAGLAVLDGLGAVPLARRARQRLRAMGVSAPAGPQADTRAHPLGLTRRQAEVLDLVSTGATNAEIADRLVLSVRTVDRHVSAILAKLGVSNRGEAARVAAAVADGD